MTEETTTQAGETGSWAAQKSKLKVQFSNLSDADFRFAPGKKDEMMTKLQGKLGKTRDEMAAIFASL